MRPTVPLDRDAILWSRPPGDRTGRALLVAMHGFYGHESDWQAWFDRVPEPYVAASLRAPVSIGERWAWADFTTQSQAALSAAARGILNWIDDVGVPSVALLGWSQGGAMAAHLLRQRPSFFLGAAMVGGFVWGDRPIARVAAARPRVWYGMGDEDDVIEPWMIERSHRWLDAHTAVTYRTYPGVTHTLMPGPVGDAMAFLAQLAN